MFELGSPEAVVSLTCSVGVRSVAPQSQGSREAGTRTAGKRLQAPVCASPWQDPVLGALEGGWEGLQVQLLPWWAQAPGADGHTPLGGGRRRAGL